MLQSVTQKFHTAKVQVTEKFKAVKDRLLGGSNIEQLSFEELNSQLQSAKSRSKAIQEDIDKQQIKVMGDAKLLEESLATVKRSRRALSNNITMLNQQLAGQKVAIKDEIALFEAYNHSCNSQIQDLKIEIDIAQKALASIKDAEEKSQLKIDEYSDKLEKATKELNRIKIEESNKTKEAINVAADADTITLQEASQKLSQRVKLEQDKNSLITQKAKNQKLFDAEAIKLLEYQEAQRQKESEIEEKKAKKTNFEQKIETNNKQTITLQKDYENIKQTIKELESSVSFSSSDYYHNNDDSLDSIQAFYEKVNSIMIIHTTTEVITDRNFPREGAEERPFIQPSPSFTNYLEVKEDIRKLLEYNYLEEAEETIKISLTMLVGYENTEHYYNYLKSFASEETGLIKGQQLEALKKDEGFREFYKLVLQHNQDPLLVAEELDQDPFEESKNDLQQNQNSGNWNDYTSYKQNDFFKSHLA
jgi:chromosome segregation ATPase